MPHWFGKHVIATFNFAVLLLYVSSTMAQDKNYREQTISFLLGDQKIVGTLTLPEQKMRVPIVLILHGFGGNRHGRHQLYARTARIWAANGIASLRISTRGRGGSHGNFHDMTLEGRTREAIGAVQWIMGRADLNSDQISVLGHSQGTIVATSLASRFEHSNTIKSLVLWAPQPNALATYRRSMGVETYNRGLNAKPDETVSWQSAAGVTRTFKFGFFKGLSKIDTMADIATYSGPLLVITGKKDRWSRTVNAKVFGDYHRAEHVFMEFNVGHQMGASEGSESLREVAMQTLHWLKAK